MAEARVRVPVGDGARGGVSGGGARFGQIGLDM